MKVCPMETMSHLKHDNACSVIMLQIENRWFQKPIQLYPENASVDPSTDELNPITTPSDIRTQRSKVITMIAREYNSITTSDRNGGFA